MYDRLELATRLAIAWLPLTSCNTDPLDASMEANRLGIAQADDLIQKVGQADDVIALIAAARELAKHPEHAEKCSEHYFDGDDTGPCTCPHGPAVQAVIRAVEGITMNTWPDGFRHAISQSAHEQWNVGHYPGTRQICCECEACYPTKGNHLDEH